MEISLAGSVANSPPSIDPLDDPPRLQYSLHAQHTIAYHTAMALVQIRDIPEPILRTLKAQAAERGLTLTAYLRAELARLAPRPTNAEIVERLARRNRRGGPTTTDTVAEIRRIRDAS